MGKTRTRAPDPFELTRIRAAWLVGLSPRRFDEAVKPLIDAGSVKGSGSTLRYEARGVVAAMVAYREQQLRASVISSDDPMLAAAALDVKSPALEEFRRYRAGQEKITLDVMEKSVVKVQDIKEGLAVLAGSLRRAIESLTHRFGNDAAAIIAAAVDRTEDEWKKLFASTRAAEFAGGSDPAPAPADAAPVRRGRDRPSRRPPQGRAVQR